MRTFLALVAALLWVPATAHAASPIRVSFDGPAVVGQTVGIVVEARADGARLTFPDLQGEVGTSACTLTPTRGRRRFVLPYRPGWAGRHVLTLSVSSGACGRGPRARWRPVTLDVAEPAAGTARAVAPGAGPCPRLGTIPARGRARAAGQALLCALNAERRALGLRALRPGARLARAASRRARAPRRAGRPGEHVLVGTGEHAAPRAVLRTWLAADGHRADLLAPGARFLGVAAVPERHGPLRLRGATWVVRVA